MNRDSSEDDPRAIRRHESESGSRRRRSEDSSDRRPADKYKAVEKEIRFVFLIELIRGGIYEISDANLTLKMPENRTRRRVTNPVTRGPANRRKKIINKRYCSFFSISEADFLQIENFPSVATGKELS